jgi:hypothetical protein
MSIATVRSVVSAFCRETSPRVLALKGGWGVGKTYLWGKLVEENKDIITRKYYSYVSLFGIASMADLRVAVLANMRPVEFIGDDMSFERANTEWQKFGTGWIATALQKSKLGEIFKGVNLAIEAIAPSLIKSFLICFDDLERLDQNKVPHDVLMGFISGLKENSDCQIVIVMNHDRLPKGEENAYEKYREKVVDIEIEFRPTVQEAIEVGLSADLKHRKAIADAAEAFCIRNIRILNRISSLAKLVEPYLFNLHEAVAPNMLPTLVLLTWCYFGKSGGAPSVEFVKKYNWVSSARKRKSDPEKIKAGVQDNEESPQETEWNAMLSKVAWGAFDEYDAAILKVVEQGYVEESGLEEELKKKDAVAKAGDLEGKMVSAWARVRKSFYDNEEEVVNGLFDATKAAASILSPMNVNSVIVLLNELERDTLANELMDHYVEQRRADIPNLAISDSVFGGDVSDPTFLAKLTPLKEAAAGKVTLKGALENMTKRNGWTQEEGAVLKAATEEQLYAVLREPLQCGSDVAANFCLRFDDLVRQNTIRALLKISGTSRLNMARVRRLGISIDSERSAVNDTVPPASA